jgi:hypothetical protein
MDPITVTIVSALAAGAAAAGKDVATSAIKDAYTGLKRLINDRYQRAAPFAEAVEADPTSKPGQEVLAKQLDHAGVRQDQELKTLAEQLLDAIGQLRAEPKAAALFDFNQLQLARNAHFKDVEAAQVLHVRGKAEIGGDLTVEGVRQKLAGSNGENHRR